MDGADIRISMPRRTLVTRARLVWHGWNVPYWGFFFASSAAVRQRLTSIMQGYLVVATLLVVMAFPTLFSLLAIKETDQRDTKAYKVCIFFLSAGCLTSLASIFMLTSALAVASLPDNDRLAMVRSTQQPHAQPAGQGGAGLLHHPSSATPPPSPAASSSRCTAPSPLPAPVFSRSSSPS